MIKKKIPGILLIFLSFCFTSYSQQKKLDINALTRPGGNPGFLNLPVSMVRWTDDSHFIISRRTHPDSAVRSFLVDAKTGLQAPAPPANAGATANKRIVVTGNDLYYTSKGKTEQLTSTKEREVNPVFSPDSNYIAFTRNNNLYTIDLVNKKETQLTTDGTDVILNGFSSWVYMEEILGRQTAYRAFWWSPDSKKIAFFRSDDSKVPVFTITDGTGQHGYAETQRYPKAGDPNPEVKVGIVSRDGGTVTWADFNEKDDQYFGEPVWRPDGNALWVLWMNRGQDHLKIYEVDNVSGKKKDIYEEKQKTWISLDVDRITFLDNNKGFLLWSDKTGWDHYYLHDMNGKLVNAVTAGNFKVYGVRHIDQKNGVLYFSANKENSNRNDLYRVNFNGKNLKRLTFGEYSHVADVSPKGSYFVTRYSNATTPTKITLFDTKGKLIREIYDAKGSDFSNYSFAKTEIVRVKSEDGKYDLPMKITWPMNMEPGKKYPVIFFVYGGPGSQAVNDTWSLNPNSQKYAADGAIMVSMSHRGSGEFGKEGQNYMHRNLGYWEMNDWIQGVKWLREKGSADPDRVFISGFSYGGYMAAYALTYGAEYFTHGVAGAGVMDWRLYDTHYTERYMDTPAENPEGYTSSSVLTHADKLKGKLLILHGNIDDNVHLQNSIQLISKLQDLNKSFEMMFYSGARHGIGGSKGAHSDKIVADFMAKYVFITKGF